MKKKLFSVSLVCILMVTYATPILTYANEADSVSDSQESIETSDSLPKEIDGVINNETEFEQSPKEETVVESTLTDETKLVDTEDYSDLLPPLQQSFSDSINVIVEDRLSVESEVESSENYTLPEEISIERTEQTELFIRRIGEIARTIGQENNLYASVMIAQAILETGSGESLLSQEPYYNLFGIKGSYEGNSIELLTLEDDGTGHLYPIRSDFKDYPSYKESFDDYATLLTEGINGQPMIYAQTWKDQASDYRAATQALTGVYATDTAYDKKLNALIEEYELVEYDKEQATKTVGNILVTDRHPDSDFSPYFGESYLGADAYSLGNCTQYVYNRITQLEGQIEMTMGNGMDWGSTGLSLGYEVNHKPKSGTAVSFQPGVAGADEIYGHVAFVEHVYEDGSILISEMNVTGLGEVSFRLLDQFTADTLTYITPK